MEISGNLGYLGNGRGYMRHPSQLAICILVISRPHNVRECTSLGVRHLAPYGVDILISLVF